MVYDWAPVYDKPSSDGSAKMNLRPVAGAETHGVIYQIDDVHRPHLDKAEPGYVPFSVTVETPREGPIDALTYRWEDEAAESGPYHWYVEAVLKGARQHRLDESYATERLWHSGQEDPAAPGIRPLDRSELGVMQEVLAGALGTSERRYTIHPGDLAWWMWHADPRYDDHVSYWAQPGEGVLVIDARTKEISAFTRTSGGQRSLIEWAQRRLDGRGRVAYVADSDIELSSYLEQRSYGISHTNRLYHWDLTTADIPSPDLPEGWDLRTLAGEPEVDGRRAAWHAAFRSTLEPGLQLERYQRFMGSPVYEGHRDLVAVAPNGRIASFVVWWPDESGIAQIEPFGTHPDFQRRSVGKALMYFGLRRMRESGMRLVRVITDEPRVDATAFYEAVGFDFVQRVRWWEPARAPA